MPEIETTEDGKKTEENPPATARTEAEETTNSKTPEKQQLQPTDATTPLLSSAEMSTKEAYFASLNAWVKHANISQQAMALFPWYMLSSYPQIFQNNMLNWPMTLKGPKPPGSWFQPATTEAANAAAAPEFGAAAPAAPNVNGAAAAPPGAALGFGFGPFRILDEQSQVAIINRTGGYEYVLAPLWKRAVAELIDMLILLLLKVIVTFTVMNIFDLDLGFDMDKDVMRKALEDEDYTSFFAFSLDFLAFSSDLLLLEMLTKVIVCFYEAIWTTMYNGATPGKAIMNLRIQYVEAVVMLQPPAARVPPPMAAPPPLAQFVGVIPVQRGVPVRALIFPAETPNLGRALLRAIAKNLVMTLLFPMCFVAIFFRNNRTAYDYITKTIVVEGNANPVLRRR